MADGTFKTRIGRVTATRDGIVNHEARLGLGSDSQISASTYAFVPVTRNRALLDSAYRSSWIVRQVVGVVADDMTRAGVELLGAADPGQVTRVQNALTRLGVWSGLASAIRWSRLYGGAVAVMMVDGQSLSDPLDPRTVGRGRFKGLTVLDRWSLSPSSQRVTTLGPDFGKPVGYTVIQQAAGEPALTDGSGDIHHTRVIRLEGDELPHFQRNYENGWAMSVIEPMYDRLVAFDSTTLGAAQMVYKAHLRILKMKNLTKNLAMGGKTYAGALAEVDLMRRYQSSEGVTLLDAENTLETTTYNFAGMSDVLVQMAQQMAGATDIPVVKLFGMSPTGFSTGDTDLRSYYDTIALRQERTLRHPLEVVAEIAWRSEVGEELPEDFGIRFNSLWGMSDVEKAAVATQGSGAIVGAEASGIISRSTALRELRNLSHVVGYFSSITDEDVEAAEEEEQTPELPQVPGVGDPYGAPDDPDASAVSDPDAGAAGEAPTEVATAPRPRLVVG